MGKRNYCYLKATNIIMKITTCLFIIEIPLIVFPMFLFGFMIDFFNHFDYSFPLSQFFIKVLLFYILFSAAYIVLEGKADRCMALPGKRKIYFIYSILKLIQTAILFFYSMFSYIGRKDLFFFVIFIVHAFIFVLSIVSLVLCLLLYTNKNTIENND